MTMSLDPPNLRHMLIPLLNRLIILELLALTRGLDALALRSVGAPEADVAVVGAGEEVVGVGGPAAGEDALHAFGVVDVAGVAGGAGPEADGAVVAGGDELFACGAEFEVHDCGDVVAEDVEGARHFPHVEHVHVVVFL